MIQGTDLYHDSMVYYEGKKRDGGALQHKVWDGTPWMVDAFTGSLSDDRDSEMREWCAEKIGPEAWPIHGRPGDWHRGGATIDGWTWFGFATEAKLAEFNARWDDTPRPTKER